VVEAQEQIVEADISVGLETVAHGGEVDRAMMFMDLNGVAAAESDVRASLTSEMGEDAPSTDSAVRVRGGCVDFAALIGPKVMAEERSAHEMRLLGEEFKSFSSLDGGSEVDGGGEDAGGIAGFDRACGWFGEDAGEAGSGKTGIREQGVRSGGIVFVCFRGSRWEDVHCCSVGADGCGVDPWFGLLNGVVID